MKLHNRQIMNPDTKEPFLRQTSPTDQDGQPWTLFDMIRISLGATPGEIGTWESLERYARISHLIRGVAGFPTDEQCIEIETQDMAWLESQCKQTWPRTMTAQAAWAAWQALKGETDAVLGK